MIQVFPVFKIEINYETSANKYLINKGFIFYRYEYNKNMRQIFIILAVGAPLFLAALFIVNSIVTDSFPMFRETPMDESQYLQQTYQAGLDHCENSYENFDTLDIKNEYEECINSVETWYVENLKK